MAPLTVDGWAAFVDDRWPGEGWTITARDREPDEAEGAFTKGSVQGVFKARPLCGADSVQAVIQLSTKEG